MIINFIAFVGCVAFGIYQLLNKRFESFILEITIAILNLPFAIKWMTEFFA